MDKRPRFLRAIESRRLYGAPNRWVALLAFALGLLLQPVVERLWY